jgi:peptide chain release factor subunit 1
MQTADIDRTTLRRLADTAPDGACVISLYVNLDPTRFATAAARSTEVRALLDDASRRIRADDGLSHDVRKQLDADVERLEAWFRNRKFAADGARGLAVFAAGEEMFEVLRLPWPVESAVHINSRPAIEPLAELATPGRWCVVLVNKREARVLRGGRDVLDEVERLTSDVHGRHMQGGWSQARYQRSVQKDVDDHLRSAADGLMRRFRRRPFDWLAVGGPRETTARFAELVHPYLRERLAGNFECDVENTNADEVLEAVEPLMREHDERREGEALARLEQGAGQGEGAARGLEPTLAALNERRVETLLFERGFSAEGVVCTQCGWVGPPGEARCPADESEVERRDNVVEDAVELAIRQSADVVALDPEPPRLDEHGGIAAVLRF